MHGVNAVFSTGIGFPQGGVCSAKFWLVAFDYAIQIINRYNIEGNGYADDCSALYGGPRLDHALKRLQKMLDDLSQWGKTCGLRFNPEKSVAVIFTRRRRQPPFNLTIDGKKIEYQTQVKYLGVTLDSKLHWTQHIDEKITKAKRYLTQIAHITRNNWGPKPRLMRWAYLGIVRPMLCYGAMIWGHRAPELIAKFRRVNRMAMNTFASFPKSTPTAALEIMLDVMPLHIHCAGEALAARVRLDDVICFGWDGLSHTKNHRRSHLRHWADEQSRHGVPAGELDTCRVVQGNVDYKINYNSFDGKAKHRKLSQINVYTDGSRLDNQAGAGYSIRAGKQEIGSKAIRLPDYATVFQAEIAAIAQATEHLLSQEDLMVKYVKFFVDSQAAIYAVGNQQITSHLVMKAVNLLNDLAKKAKNVSITWIPAHKGHEGNERADELAKEGAKANARDQFLQVPRPLSDIKAKIKNAQYKDWRTEWQSYQGANHTKSFYDGPNVSKARFVYKLARLELGRFIRIITGHNNLRFFQTKIGLWGDSACRLCGQGPETITHFIRNCSRMEGKSEEHFLKMLPSPDMKWSVRGLLDFSYIPEINEAFEGEWDNHINNGGTSLDEVQEIGLSQLMN